MEYIYLVGVGVFLCLLFVLWCEYRCKWYSPSKRPPTNTPILFAYGCYVTKGYVDTDGHWWDMADPAMYVPSSWISAWCYLPMPPFNRAGGLLNGGL